MMLVSEIPTFAESEFALGGDRSDDFYPETLARMSDNELMQCSRERLMQLVQDSAPVLPAIDFDYRLSVMSREQLEQLAFLARRGCQLRD